MTITLYHVPASPPVRTVMLTLKALDLKYEEVLVDLIGGELQKSENLKINPVHTVPYINDNGFVLYDSHAIITYLVNKYGGEDNPLYPKDLQKRAMIDQRLHFDSGILYPRLRCISEVIIFDHDKTPPSKYKIDKVIEAYKLTEALLGDNDWIAGDTMTLGDFSCVAEITGLCEVLVPDVPVPNKVKAWVDRCKKTMKCYEETGEKGNKNYKELISSILNS